MSNDHDRAKEATARIREGQKIGFDEWLHGPVIRALISTVPPNDALLVLLRSAFECGYSLGTINIILETLRH